MNDVLDKLAELFLLDIEVLSMPWMWMPLCIPAVSYLVWMAAKWFVLTMPVWIPLVMWRGVRSSEHRNYKLDLELPPIFSIRHIKGPLPNLSDDE